MLHSARAGRALALATLTLLATRPAFAGDVLVVDGGGSGDFTTIQAAVDAADDGDLVLVLPGSYAAFEIVNKGLSVVADSTPVSVAAPGVGVSGTLVEQPVLLAGLSCAGSKIDGVELAALRLFQTRGAVRVEDSSFTGGGASGSSCWIGCGADEVAGGAAVVLERALDVAFVRCAIAGAGGRSCVINSENHGGPGIRARGSLVSLFDCVVRGGDGGGQCSFDPFDLADGGDGGAGLLAEDDGALEAFVQLSGSSVGGGDGGDGGACIDQGGDGGDGLVLVGNGPAGARALLLETTFGVGSGGCGGSPSSPGQPVVLVGNALTIPLPGEAPAFRVASPETGVLSLSFEGRAGDRVRVLRADEASYAPRLDSGGVLFLEPTALATPLFEGVLPGSGQLQASVPAPKLPVGEEGRALFLQAVFDDAAPGVKLGPPATPAILAH